MRPDVPAPADKSGGAPRRALPVPAPLGLEWRMTDAAVKAAVSLFVKHASYATQRELEKVVGAALAKGTVKSGEPFTAAVTLSSPKLDLDVTIYGKIEL